jgi:hypothetical protein
MTINATAEVVSQRQIDPASIVINETIVAVAAPNISLYAGANVPNYRQLEIITGWERLWEGVRDRNLLDVQFKGNILYTGYNINSRTENNRRTTSLVTAFTDDDIILGIGASVSNNFSGAVLHLEVSIDSLIAAVHEQLLKAA